MSPPPKPRRGLGRGLDALLPAAAATPAAPAAPAQPASSSGDRTVFPCALEKLVPKKGQPRKHFDPERLEELAASIKEHGLIEPIVVRKVSGSDKYEIVAGERRWRACQKAGLLEPLVIVKDFSDAQAFEVSLIENVQREDLNAIEFAEALDALVHQHGHTIDSLAKAIGKDRSTISNALRLLKLPASIRESVVDGELSEGHARALLGAGDEKSILRAAAVVLKKRLSVRQTEALVRSSRDTGDITPPAPKKKSVGVRDLELRLARSLGAPCTVKDRDGKGEIKIAYSSLDELDRLLERLL